MYPKKPQGRFHNYRIVVTIILLAALFSGPFIKIGEQPLLLLNFFERKFVILGQAFWPQDFFLFALLLVTFFVFIILFTVAFGRIWCGWACPQTLFMEMVFRKIEYWIEGNANQQRKLDRAPWNGKKILKKGSKHVIFIAISLMISHTVMAYLIGIEDTIAIVSQSPTEHLGGFLGLIVFTAIFYWVFAYFREQACIAVCPYGRLQSVLLIRDSIVVAYDWIRGEPRGKLKKNKVQEDKGDCIDCKLCVHVCPTGIDIRNGTQLECVNCTACIDACDEVMTKIDKPTGLIRYTSYNDIQDGITKLLTARTIGYSAVLLVLLSALTFLIVTRSDIETTILKVPGTLYQKTDDGQISNLYNVQFVNKTFEQKNLELRLSNDSKGSLLQVGGNLVKVEGNDHYKGVFLIKIPVREVTNARTNIKVDILADGELIDTRKTKFLGPVYTGD